MNNRHLIKLWLFPIIIFSFLIIIIITNPKREYILLGFIPIGAVIFYLFIRSFTKKRIETLFKNQNVNEILRYYDSSINPSLIPEGEFLKACNRSIALSLYGHFDTGLLEIADFKLSDKPPIFQAMQLNAIAANNFLQRINICESLELSKKAKQLSKVSKFTPGRKQSENAYDAYIEIGEILNGNFDAGIIQNLEDRFTNSLFILKIQIAWALGIVYTQLNEQHKKNQIEKYLHQHAPHCIPLLNI